MKNQLFPAVITADMVNSTRFTSVQTGNWLTALLNILRDDPTLDWELKPEIYRGDSFQGVLKTADQALKVAILSRVIMRSNTTKTDLRIAIGIGATDLITDRPGTSDGEAFRLSGRLADQIRLKKARIAFALPVPSTPLESTMDLLETMIGSWSVAQCEVVHALLSNYNITQIAEKLSISQPAVSQRVASAKWWAVESLLASFPAHLALYSKP